MIIKDRKLRQLVRVAAQLQTNEHNSPNAIPADAAIEDVEKHAETLGFKTIWPGIFPVFYDQNNTQYEIE